jgi:ribosomal-protein-serine acetyltransferase
MDTIEIQVEKKGEEDLKLCLLSENDLQEVYELMDKNRKFFEGKDTFISNIYQANDALGYVSSNKRYRRFGIYYDKKLVGTVSVQDINYNMMNCSLGYWLDEEYTGKGIMSKSINKIISFCFEQLRLNSIELEIKEDNIKSKALAERLRFKFYNVTTEIINDDEWIWCHYILESEKIIK